MSAVHALNGHPTTTHPVSPARPDTVKNPLTPDRPGRVVENDQYAAFARRVLRAYARRVADGDVEALTLMLGLSAEIDTAIAQAVTGLRGFGYSWAEIGSRLGITRQAAQQRWGPRILTAATAALDPEPTPGSGSGVTADDTVTVSWADFKAWERQLTTCTHPIRLRGRIDALDLATGELAPVYDTATQPGGVLHVACGNRRETVCPACSQVYKRDARQLVRAGLAGGKGIPETITAHPCVFATLTAPSFGPVHARRMRGKTVLPCRPRRDANARRCPHGRDISCPTRHMETDPRLGQPMCPDCYDYTSAVLFNAYAGDLWRRFVTYLPRRLARLAGVTQKMLHDQLSIRFVKVAEYQARGVVHFHAVIRLDAPDEDYQPPPTAYTADLLCDAIDQAAAAVARTAEHRGQVVMLGFGSQTDRRPLRRDTIVSTGKPLDAEAVANYIAKYAIKTLHAPGVPDTRIRHASEITGLRCSAHYRAMIVTAWELGARQATGDTRFRQWAHMLGYSGHFLTKSRRYSVTFGQLRAARTDYRRAQRHPDGERDPWGRPLDETVVLILTTWTYAGTGHNTAPGAQLALASAARAREHHGPAVAVGGKASTAA